MRVLIVDVRGEEYAQQIVRQFPNVEVQVAHSLAEALPHTEHMEALVGLTSNLYPQLTRNAPRLRWIQFLTSGTDTLDSFENLYAEVMVTSGRGIHAPQVVELTFLHMMFLARHGMQMVANQIQAQWQRWPQPLLWRKTLTIIGMGVIGRELAVRAHGFGMHVIGVSRTQEPVQYVDKIYPRDQLPTAVAPADFVVLILPYEPSSHHLVDAAALHAMKKTAYLINVARGGVVDEAALLKALHEGTIAGAGLDVFAQEPLPADSQLWRAPNVFITPHVGGFSDIYAQQAAPILLENLGLFLAGRYDQLINRVR